MRTNRSWNDGVDFDIQFNSDIIRSYYIFVSYIMLLEIN